MFNDTSTELAGLDWYSGKKTRVIPQTIVTIKRSQLLTKTKSGQIADISHSIETYGHLATIKLYKPVLIETSPWRVDVEEFYKFQRFKTGK